jgi:hypothetical protein
MQLLMAYKSPRQWVQYLILKKHDAPGLLRSTTTDISERLANTMNPLMVNHEI